MMVKHMNLLGLCGFELIPEGIRLKLLERPFPGIDHDQDIGIGFQNLFGGEGDIATK